MNAFRFLLLLWIAFGVFAQNSDGSDCENVSTPSLGSEAPSLSDSTASSENENCPFCLEPVKKSDSPGIGLFECEHWQFHKPCIDEHLRLGTLRPDCPKCRQPTKVSDDINTYNDLSEILLIGSERD